MYNVWEGCERKMIISGSYGMISPIYDRLYLDYNQAEAVAEPKSESIESVQPIQKLAPISNGVEASAGLEFKDGRAQIGTTSRLEELDVEKEMSEVQKDKAIEQYQYFIQDKYQDEDPFFRMIMKF